MNSVALVRGQRRAARASARPPRAVAQVAAAPGTAPARSVFELGVVARSAGFGNDGCLGLLSSCTELIMHHINSMPGK